MLLHGISNSGRAWGPQLPALAQSGYRVIAPDLAGHGASARLDAPLGVDHLADDVELLLSQLGIETADLVGLSLGGMIAIELALRRPDRIGRLVVANSFEKTTTPAFRAALEGWAAIFERPHGPVERLERNWPALVSPAFQKTAEGLRTYQVWHGVAATADGASLAHVARGIGAFGVSERIASLAPPTLFIAGSLDRMSPPEASRRMAERARRGRFDRIDGAAHISNVDSAQAFFPAAARLPARGLTRPSSAARQQKARQPFGPAGVILVAGARFELTTFRL